MNDPILAKEGWPFIAIALAVALLATWWLGVWSWPLWGLLIFVVQFFRDPPRIPPAGDDNVLSPADGRIVAVINTQDPWLERPALKISVFMNVFNVHANRSPVTGVVKQKWYRPGKFFNAALDKASLENERCALWIKRADGQDVLSVQIAGLIARRILCYAKEGDALQAGGRYGFIRFGSRVDVYMHPSAKAQVAPGEKVKAGLTVLAKLAGS